MQLSVTSTASIRPLGEEHLRMFRRMTQSEDSDAPKITLPKKLIRRPEFFVYKVPAWKDPMRFRDAKRIGKENGGRLPSMQEFLSEFERQGLIDGPIHEEWFWIADKINLPKGHHRLDKKTGKIERASKTELRRLAPHEQIYVDGGPGPMAIRMYDNRSKGQGISIVTSGQADNMPTYMALFVKRDRS